MGFGTMTVNGAVSFETPHVQSRRDEKVHLDDVELKYNEDGEHTLKLIKYFSDGRRIEQVVFATEMHSSQS